MVVNTVSHSLPIVVVSCPPATGHTTPLLAQATHLANRGFEVHFIAGRQSEAAILATGAAAFYPVEDPWTPEKHEQMFAIPEGPERFIFGLKNNFVDCTPGAFSALKNVLELVREKYPTRDVVILQETAAMSVGPFFLGAPLPRGYNELPKVVTFSTVPLPIASIDHAPFGPGFPPDSSAEGRARNRAMYEAGKPLWDAVAAYVNEVYAGLGTTKQFEGVLMDAMIANASVYLQACSPSLEYPRSDLPANVRFIGAHPRKEIAADTVLPEWWDEVLVAKREGNKKVVFVSQGTFQLDYDMLLKPTIEALADRDDCLVIAALGVKGATLNGVTLPPNAKVVDFLLYDAVLPYADAFVSNAGYGGFLHGVMHGVPMVLGGSGQDKAEVSARGEWAGIAVNLKTDRPSVEAIRDSVNTVLTDSKYKTRCVEIQRENEELDSRAQVERAILEFARP
ncbi:glycosyltransferase family 1 protein [Aspergillus pseudoustus]|uniref:Glycosyltransferase family 1 protein n=1 Tax=Aspergillus pseudoustus TaxID=1810923 RepID=A0ABR4IL21_9EURO